MITMKVIGLGSSKLTLLMCDRILNLLHPNLLQELGGLR